MPDARSLEAVGRLLDVMARLRGPDGCPWDREQTHESLRPYALEEAYEVVDAIDRGDPEALAAELGDLLLQVVFHAQLAAETGTFSMADVARAIVEKLERRHPHVFGEARVRDAAEVSRNWQRIKEGERPATTVADALATIPRALPALARAEKTAGRLARRGFDWQSAAGVIDKIEEEVAELRRAVLDDDVRAAAAELGDLLLAAASLARRLEVSAELALADATARLVARATAAEALAQAGGTPFADLDATARDTLWDAAKRETG
jgi:MazG family protein